MKENSRNALVDNLWITLQNLALSTLGLCTLWLRRDKSGIPRKVHSAGYGRHRAKRDGSPVGGASQEDRGVGGHNRSDGRSVPCCNERLRNLILYLAQRSVGDAGFGSTKLNKLLFYIDFLAYARTGASVTGLQYQRIKHGPALIAMKPTLVEMQNEGALDLEPRGFLPFKQKVPVALVDADLSLFSSQEIALFDEVLGRFKNFNNTQISDEAYREFSLTRFAEGQEIPYAVAVIDNRAPTQKELQWAVSMGVGQMAAAWHNARRKTR